MVLHGFRIDTSHITHRWSAAFLYTEAVKVRQLWPWSTFSAKVIESSRGIARTIASFSLTNICNRKWCYWVMYELSFHCTKVYHPSFHFIAIVSHALSFCLPSLHVKVGISFVHLKIHGWQRHHPLSTFISLIEWLMVQNWPQKIILLMEFLYHRRWQFDTVWQFSCLL